LAGRDPSAEDGMSDLISMMAMAPTSGALVVLALLMALRVVRALRREPVRSRRASGARLRPNGV
jgi:hypothetical protein